MAVLLRVLCWNIAEGSNDQTAPANSALPAIAEHILAKAPDVVLLNEVKNWDLGAFGWQGDYVRGAQRLAELTGMPFVHWVNTVRTGWTGHKAVAVLSRYPLTPPVAHPILRAGTAEPTGYATMETTLVVDGVTHHAFSTRFDHAVPADNAAAHEQSRAIVQGLSPGAAVLFGGDFNANRAEHEHFRTFLATCGMANAFIAHPDPEPCATHPDRIVDHIFFRGNYAVRQMEIRCPWGEPGVSDHPWLFTELCSPPEGFAATYGSVVKLKHAGTGHALHSHAHDYSHPGTSGQQQVTAYHGADDNDLWKVKAPHGQPDGDRAGQPVLHGQTLRLEHVLTGRNLHSHAGIPSPVTGQQEVTCYGTNGVGDGNDDWRIEIEGGGAWSAGGRVRLIHVPTNHALHSHRGYAHLQWTMGQQEVTGFSGRDDNDWWVLFQRTA